MGPIDMASSLETESMSFRLNKNELNQLREMARANRESLNSLVSQILDRYLKLWVFDKRFGFFSISKELIQRTFVKMSDKEIEEMADDVGARVHEEIIRHLYGRVNKKTVVEYLDIFCKRFDAYNHFTQGSRYTLAITHDINLAFSKVYYNITKSTLALAKINTIETEQDVSELGFSITFDVQAAAN